MPKKPKFYGVRCGRTLGVFTTWKMCEASTKGWPNAKHKSFPSRAEAEAFSAAGGHEPAAAAPRSEGGARSADAASPSFAVGASCVLRGLVGGAKHNGKCVDVIVPLGRDAAHPFRVRVRLPCGDLIAVKPQNLEACAAAKPKNSIRGYFGGPAESPPTAASAVFWYRLGSSAATAPRFRIPSRDVMTPPGGLACDAGAATQTRPG